MAIIPAIMAGVSITEGILNSRSARNQAKANIEMIDKQLELIVENKEALEKAYTAQKGYVTDKYGNAYRSMNEQFGVKYEDAQNQYDNAMSRSDLAYSGTVEKSFNMANRELVNNYQTEAGNRRDAMQGTMLDMATQHQSQINELHAQWQQLRGQRDAFNQQKKSRFLGIF